MLRTWTELQALRIARNSLIFHGISFGILLIFIWFLSDYFYWFFRGPALISDVQLLEMIDKNRDRQLIGYVELRDRTLIPTEWREVSTADGRPYSSYPFFLLRVGPDQSILVLARDINEGQHLIGPLGPARDIEHRVISKIVQKHPELQDKIMPIVLSHVAAFPVAGYVMLVFFIPWGAFAGWYIARAVMGQITHSSPVINRQLAKVGAIHSLEESINDEIQRQDVKRFGKAILTQSWILRPTMFGATCVRLDDVVWAYALHRTSENFAVLNLRHGQTVAIFLSKSDSVELISTIASRAPWVIAGFSADLQRMWSKNRSKMIAESDQRREPA